MCAKSIRDVVVKHCDNNHVEANILIIKGMVNDDQGFSNPHIVINAASEYLNRYYDPHAREAKTYSGLPLDACVEISAIVEFTAKASKL